MLWQLIVNGFVAGSIYALVGLGFSLIYNVVKFFHFTHGAIFTLGAYAAFFSLNILGAPFFLSVLIAIGVSVIVGFLLNLVVFSSISRRNGSSLELLLASLGLYILIQNIISLCFGDGIKTLRSGTIKTSINFIGAKITFAQVSIVVTCIVSLIVMALFLHYTRIGKSMIAVSTDKALAEICGINSSRVTLYAFGFGSALAGLAGVLVALDVDLMPTMGLRFLMMGIVAVVVGGSHSIIGVALGGLFLGLLQNLSAWKIGSQWQDLVSFVVLLVFLLMRPEGFLGRKVKQNTL